MKERLIKRLETLIENNERKIIRVNKHTKHSLNRWKQENVELKEEINFLKQNFKEER